MNISDVTTSVVLTSVMTGRVRNGFVAEEYMPSAPTKNRFGKIYKAGKEGLRSADARMRSGAMSNRVDVDYSKTTYETVKEGEHIAIDDELLDNADKPIDARKDMTIILADRALLRHEIRAAAIAQSTASITDVAAAARWDAGSGQAPRTDVNKGKKSIRQKAGRDPNAIILPPDCRDALVAWFLSQAQVSYGEISQVVELPKMVFGMKPIVPIVVYDSANYGQSASLSDVYSNVVTLCIVDRPSTSYMGAFLNIRRKKIGSKGYRVRQWYDKVIESEFVEVQLEEDEIAVDNDYAYIIKDVIT